MIRNLWKVTEEFLALHDKTWKDVVQVQATASGCVFDLKAFEALLKASQFDSEYPEEVASDLVLVGEKWAARWDRGWVWMYIPELGVPKVEGACPTVVSSRMRTDADGCVPVTYYLTVQELNPVSPE